MKKLHEYSNSREYHFYRGRVSLFAILKALEVGINDEVATQAFTCVAVPEAIMAVGAKPIYIDIEADGFNMDPQNLRNKLHDGVKAVILQHTFGIPAQFDKLEIICKSRGIPIIEDCCHTVNSTINGKLVGTLGVASFFSYEWGKPLVAGIGGSLLVNDANLIPSVDKIYEEFIDPPRRLDYRMYVQYLMHWAFYRPSLYWQIRKVYKTLTSFGIAQGNYNTIDVDNPSIEFSWKMLRGSRNRLELKKQHINLLGTHSDTVAAIYRSDIVASSIIHPKVIIGSRTVYCRYPLRIPSKKVLLEDAKREKVELADWYLSPVHPLKGTQLQEVSYEQNSCPNAEKRCNETVSLPLKQDVSQRVADKIVEFLNRKS